MVFEGVTGVRGNYRGLEGLECVREVWRRFIRGSQGVYRGLHGFRWGLDGFREGLVGFRWV